MTKAYKQTPPNRRAKANNGLENTIDGIDPVTPAIPREIVSIERDIVEYDLTNSPRIGKLDNLDRISRLGTGSTFNITRGNLFNDQKGNIQPIDPFSPKNFDRKEGKKKLIGPFFYKFKEKYNAIESNEFTEDCEKKFFKAHIKRLSKKIRRKEENYKFAFTKINIELRRYINHPFTDNRIKKYKTLSPKFFDSINPGYFDYVIEELLKFDYDDYFEKIFDMLEK